MLRRLAKRLLFGVAFFSFAVCARPPIQRYPDAAKSTTNIAVVGVVWLSSLQAVNNACAFLSGEDPTTTRFYGCYSPATKIIYTVEPTSFNDHFALEVLGHELWHALGAEHPE